MDNELSLQQIHVTQGNIRFDSFEQLKKEATELSEKVSDVKVTEENVKESKKLVAAIAKRVKELESRRISIKKIMLEPYQEFEEKVKEIVSIVDNSEEIVRNQIRELEEKERFEKRDQLEELFNKRISQYSFKDFFTFFDFLKPSHLNKSVSVESVEKEMVDFLEKITKDFEVIEVMEEKERLISFYIDEKDLGQAISRLNKEKARTEQIMKSEWAKEIPKQKEWVITFFDEKDFKLVEMFMQQNQIKFHVSKEN
jgi:hypothetical protein